MYSKIAIVFFIIISLITILVGEACRTKPETSLESSVYYMEEQYMTTSFFLETGFDNSTYNMEERYKKINHARLKRSLGISTYNIGERHIKTNHTRLETSFEDTNNMEKQHMKASNSLPETNLEKYIYVKEDQYMKRNYIQPETNNENSTKGKEEQYMKNYIEPVTSSEYSTHDKYEQHVKTNHNPPESNLVTSRSNVDDISSFEFQPTEKKRIFIQFTQFDKDNNNKIDGCELMKCSLLIRKGEFCENIMEHFDQESFGFMIDIILKNMDLNSDGFLDYLEFILYLKRKRLRELRNNY